MLLAASAEALHFRQSVPGVKEALDDPSAQSLNHPQPTSFFLAKVTILDWRQEENGMTEGEMAGRHHQLNGHEFEQTPRDSEWQENSACCSSWVSKSQTRLREWTTTATTKSQSHGAETNHFYCIFSKFLTHRTYEGNNGHLMPLSFGWFVTQPQSHTSTSSTTAAQWMYSLANLGHVGLAQLGIAPETE